MTLTSHHLLWCKKVIAASGHKDSSAVQKKASLGGWNKAWSRGRRGDGGSIVAIRDVSYIVDELAVVSEKKY